MKKEKLCGSTNIYNVIKDLPKEKQNEILQEFKEADKWGCEWIRTAKQVEEVVNKRWEEKNFFLRSDLQCDFDKKLKTHIHAHDLYAGKITWICIVQFIVLLTMLFKYT